MRKSLVFPGMVLLAAALLSMPAQAQPISGLYIAGGVGANYPEKVDLDIFGRQAAVEFDEGWAGVLSLGWGFGNGLRAEIEGNSRGNRVEGVTRNGVPVPSGGQQRQHGVSANILFDAVIPGFEFLHPYIGLGAGYAWTEWDQVRGASAGRDGGRLSVDGRDGRFAYQGIIGAAFPLVPLAPGLAVTAEYRFLGTLPLHLDLAFVSGRNVVTRGQVTPDNHNHSILFGLRYSFGAM